MRTSLLIGICAAAFAAAPAIAADLPLKAPPAPPVPVFSWTGLYIGANIGGAWSNGSITDQVTGANLSSNSSGFIGGGQIGYNYQFNTFVLGVEWDIDGTSIKKTSNVVPTAFGNLQASASTDWISTLTARPPPVRSRGKKRLLDDLPRHVGGKRRDIRRAQKRIDCSTASHPSGRGSR